MEFEKLLIRINEIIHKSIEKYKEEVIGSSQFTDITVSQLFYMEAIYSLDTPTLSELAKRLKITNASASIGVQKLVKSGLVNKSQSSHDKRAFHISLSEEGRKLVETESKAFSEFAENIQSILTYEEQAALEKIFTKILDRYH